MTHPQIRYPRPRLASIVVAAATATTLIVPIATIATATPASATGGIRIRAIQR